MVRNSLRPLTMATFTLLFGACSGGEGGNVSLSGGAQDPDPVVVDIPIAYVRRPVGEIPDPRDLTAFSPGAELVLKDRAAPSAPSQVISNEVFAQGELYDVRNLTVSIEGDRLLFTMRAPEDPDSDEIPTWNIWEYDHSNGSLRRVIESDISAEAGDDMAPIYLADGRIAFLSNRQRRSRAIRLDEGRPQYPALTEDFREPALVLHVMDADGGDIDQISFNQSHDFAPTLMQDGHLLFGRWDNMGGRNGAHFYRMRPDGRDLQLLYGTHSHDTGFNGGEVQFMRARELEDGGVVSVLKPFIGTDGGGDMLFVDIDNYVEADQPTWENTGLSAPGQESLTVGEVRNDGSLSPHGLFASVDPLWDGTGRMLVSWSECRILRPDQSIGPCTEDALADPTSEAAPPLYGIWVYDSAEESQKPVVSPEEGTIFSDVVALQPRPLPDFLPDGVAGVELDADLAAQGLATLHIRSVYDFDGTDTAPNGIVALSDPVLTAASERPARFLRLVKSVGIPDEEILDLNPTAFGRSAAQQMREILGYVPIEPDGSVKALIPANVPIAISIVDANGQRVGGRHRNWLQFRPGEEAQCLGCHDNTSELPHGRLSAQAPSANPGAPTTGEPFPNTLPALFTDMGESMAETWARINEPRLPSVDLLYHDQWTDPEVDTPDPDLALAYSDLTTAAPTSGACVTDWQASCRITIHYPDHIQPLWDAPRPVFDTDGMTVLEDRRCSSCHSPTDDLGNDQIPAAQLDLLNAPSSDQPDHLVSYRTLLFGDNERVLDDMDRLVDLIIPLLDANGNPLFETDEDGNVILDADGNPIPLTTTVPVPALMSVGGARASGGFFAPFQPGGVHSGWLTGAELRLISEWLDIGAQYYNDPFSAPQ